MKTLFALATLLALHTSAFGAETFCYNNKLFCADVVRIVDAEGGADIGLDPMVIEFANARYDAAAVEKEFPSSFFYRFHPVTMCQKLVDANIKGAARNFMTWDVQTVKKNGQEKFTSFKCIFTNN